MRCDVFELEEQTIARYLGRLQSNIYVVVLLQSYWTYDDVFKIAIKVGQQLKAKGGGCVSRSYRQENSSN